MVSLSYGVLTSVRHQAKKTNDLLNRVTARLGVAIKWHVETGFHEILQVGGGHILFKKRGNKYANYLEFYSTDIQFLEYIKTIFPDDFKAEVVREEGLLE